MKHCIRRMQIAGKLIRFPGGYWAQPTWIRWHEGWFGTSTVNALVKRGIAEYIEWKESKKGPPFPIAVTLKNVETELAPGVYHHTNFDHGEPREQGMYESDE
jgi:hypothetical protein